MYCLDKMRLTIADVAQRLDVDKEIARGLVKFIVDANLARSMGERRPESGRGRAEAVYLFEEDFEKRLAVILKRGKLSGD